ncbi:hypothetical protein ACS0TY_013758 [Phlomoides rotata]
MKNESDFSTNARCLLQEYASAAAHLPRESHVRDNMDDDVEIVVAILIIAHMAVDPYEEEVPDSFTDVNDGNERDDGFIDQVESSPAWTSWRDNLAIQMWAEYA